MYAYTVTAIMDFKKITNDVQKVQDFFDDYNSDCYNELFYYGCEHNDFNFIPTYKTNIYFDFEKCQYIFSYVCHHEKENMMDCFKQMFTVNDFDINKIFDIDGGYKKEAYDGMEIHEIIIESGKLDYHMSEVCSEDDNYE